MSRYRKFRRRASGAEEALQSLRSDPRKEFVRELVGRLQAERGPARRPWSRLAFAAAASTLIVGVFASFGGFAYAADSASTTYFAVKQIVIKHKVAVTVRKSSASDQYGPKPSPPQPAQQPAAQTLGVQSGVAAARSAKTLPFTGFSLGATVLLSCVLIAVGLVLRRRERNEA
jgi:hypothetical protein